MRVVITTGWGLYERPHPSLAHEENANTLPGGGERTSQREGGRSGVSTDSPDLFDNIE